MYTLGLLNFDFDLHNLPTPASITKKGTMSEMYLSYTNYAMEELQAHIIFQALCLPVMLRLEENT